MIFLPLLFVALLEIGLRLGSYGNQTEFFIKSGAGEFRTNDRFGWRFFPRGAAREPVQTILSVKRPGTFRIFVLGDSAAQGVPDPAFNFGRILESMLWDRYPGAKFEIINAAMTAINSHVTLEIARACARQQPDLFIVYMGNNEVIGPYGPGTVFQKWNPSLFLIRTNIRVKSMRTGQFLESAARSLGSLDRTSVWRGMEMFLGNDVPADDPRLVDVNDNLRRNLEDICGVARRANAAVILSTLAVNLRNCPPFASRHRTGISNEDLSKWESEFRAGVELESQRQYRAALARYQSAARLDDRFAELRFRMGRCFDAEGRFKEALDSYIAALDLDALRFRADTQINRTIRNFAAEKPGEIHLVDAQRSLAANDLAVGGIPGKELFFEHVHFTFDGNYALALSFLDQMEAALPQLAKWRKANHVLSRQECKQALALTPRDEYYSLAQMRQLMSRQPFSGQLDHAIQLTEMRERETVLRRLTSTREAFREARGIYEAALEKTPGDWVLHKHFAKVLIDEGDLKLAAEHLHIAQKMYPWDASLYMDLGFIETQNGRNNEAAAFYRKALELSPDNLLALSNLGRALTGLNQTNEAIAQYEKVFKIDPDYEAAHVNLAVTMIKQGRLENAVTHLRKAAAINSENANTRFSLGLVLADLGRINEAIQAYSEVLELASDHEAAHMNLGGIMARQGRSEEAIAHFRKVTELNPGYAEALYSLGIALSGAGRIDEAMACYRRVLELEPGNESARVSLGIVLAQRGQISEAIVQFRKVAAANPDNAIAYYNLGRLLADSGRANEAAEMYGRALKINPDLQDARKAVQALTGRN